MNREEIKQRLDAILMESTQAETYFDGNNVVAAYLTDPGCVTKVRAFAERERLSIREFGKVNMILGKEPNEKKPNEGPRPIPENNAEKIDRAITALLKVEKIPEAANMGSIISHTTERLHNLRRRMSKTHAR